MKSIHWITALFLKLGAVYLMLIGLLIGLIAQHLFHSDPRLPAPYFAYGVGVPMLVCAIFAGEAGENFYGDRYRQYMKEYGAGRLHIPLKDYWFYETQLSNISIKRKVAGYIYAASVIWINISFGLIFGFIGWPLFKGHYHLTQIPI